MEFEEYYKSLGLSTYPFSVYTAEGEIEKGDSIYKKPENYSVIDEGLKSSSIIVTGERGAGKTALNMDICRRKNINNILLIKVDEFSQLKEAYSSDELYTFFTECISAEFFDKMSSKPHAFWKYSKNERIDLSMYLHKYVRASSKVQLREKIKSIQNSIIKKSTLSLYNSTRVALNYGLKALTKVASDALTKHFSSLPEFDIGDAEYFRKIESEVDQSFTDEEKSFFYLNKLCKLILKSEINEIIFVIDKIDEDPRFKNDAEMIGNFIEGIASNNKIMVNDKLKVILFVWSTPFNFIKSNVRTQKLILQPLTWTDSNLISAAGKRLKAYSNGEIEDINTIFSTSGAKKIQDIINMANENPRDLWHILDKIMKSQYSIDSTSKISEDAINRGIRSFVENFNYYEYYPKKSNARADSMDIYSYIKHLLKLDTTEFTKNKLSELAGTGGSTVNYVTAMENMGLIKKTGDKSPQGGVLYEVRDPKVKYALENNFEISK